MGMVTSTHLPPPVIIDSTAVLKWVTHMLCWSWAMYFSAAASSENDQGNMNLASRPLHDAVERRDHPGNGRMLHPALDVGDAPAGVALVPGAVEPLRGGAKLHDEIAGQVLRLGLASFLAPETEQRSFIATHDDPGIRAADEGAPRARVVAGALPHGLPPIL